MEYCTLVWSPSLRKDIAIVESPQRRFTKMITEYRDIPSSERLVELGSNTVETRRIKFDLVTAFKIWKGLLRITPGNSKVRDLLRHEPEPKVRNLRRSPRIRKPLSRSKIRASCFGIRILDSWNDLTPEIRSCDSLRQFKQHIALLDLNIYTKYQL